MGYGEHMNEIGDCNPQCPPQIYTGEDKNLTVRLWSKSNKLPFDLTSASEIIAAFINADGTILQLSMTSGAITLLSAPGGAMQIALTAAQTTLLAVASGNGYQGFQIKITIGGRITIKELPNSIQVVAPLFTA